MFCIKCGAQVSETSGYCSKCGTPVFEEVIKPEKPKSGSFHVGGIIGFIIGSLLMIAAIYYILSTPVNVFNQTTVLLVGAVWIFIGLAIVCFAFKYGRKKK